MQKIIEILKSVGEDTRLRIIALLNSGELSAGELSIVLAQSQPRVSRHIKLLAEAGVIEKRTEGSWVFVCLTNKEPVKSLINHILDSIDDDSFIIARDLTKLNEIRNARQERAQKYFEKIAPEWQSLRNLHQPDEVVEKELLAEIGNRKFDFHLDLGSGMGRILEVMADNTKRAEGIDTSHGMLNLARTRFDELGLKHIGVRLGDVYSLPYENQSADLVTIYQVLHYLEDPQSALTEAARILRKDGILFVADFAPHNFEDLRNKYGHLRLGFYASEVENWCKKSGLKVIDTKTFKDASRPEALEVNLFKIIKE